LEIEMTNSISWKTLYGQCLFSLGGILLGIQTANAELVGEFSLRLSGRNPQAPAAQSQDCLFSDTNGSIFRSAMGTGAAKQDHCGFEGADAQRRDGRSVWTVYLVTLRAKDNPDVIQTYTVFATRDSQRCMISERDGDTSQVSLMRFPGTGPVCGATLEQLAADRRALWDIRPTFIAVPIRSYATDKCLIFGNNGVDTSAQLYRWSYNPEYVASCGLPSTFDLEGTYQATFLIRPIR
jgi:hypothetical protein